MEIKRTVKQGSYIEQAKISYSPIGVERISLFNIGANYQQFLASTVIPALLHILAMIIGATTIGREIRDKTFSQWYHTIVYPDMPYPDFKALKHLPPAQKLAKMQADLDASWQGPIDYNALSTQTLYPLLPQASVQYQPLSAPPNWDSRVCHKQCLSWRWWSV
nr:hypothetical protein [Psychrobacter sp. PraFG1]UNK05977.1 hypothetical protein MN210_04500 [Psychrobacter sp. PraFG1]